VKVPLACLLAAFIAPGIAHPAEGERQTQRALMERDRQAAEFSRPELRDMPRRGDAEPLRPDERVLRSREREAYLLQHVPAPQAPRPAEAPLPLPGGRGHAVDPVPVQRPRG
jgi:hypothetical protein